MIKQTNESELQLAFPTDGDFKEFKASFQEMVDIARGILASAGASDEERRMASEIVRLWEKHFDAPATHPQSDAQQQGE